MINKRKILQPILDKIELGWTIVEPDSLNPGDPWPECVFKRYEKLEDQRETIVEISNRLFERYDLTAIERLVRNAIKNAKLKS